MNIKKFITLRVTSLNMKKLKYIHTKKRLTLEQIADLTNIELIEIAESCGINLSIYAQELEPGKYLLSNREKVEELLEKRWRDIRTEESVTTAKYALWIALFAALAAIASVIVSILQFLKPV